MADRHLSLSYQPEDRPSIDGPLIVDIRDEEKFTVVDALPASAFLDMADVADSDDERSQFKAVSIMLDAMFIPEDRARFRQYVRAADPVMALDEMMFYVRAITEAITGRPIEGQQDSPTSLPATPTGLTDGTGAVGEIPSGGSSL